MSNIQFTQGVCNISFKGEEVGEEVGKEVADEVDEAGRRYTGLTGIWLQLFC
jgi:hypothetical protein